MTTTAKGQCLCGAVRYETSGPLRAVSVCHCKMCRRWHGHIGAYTAAARSDFTLTEQRGLTWHRSSDFARRGYCRECGSSLFWERLGAPTISITAGSLDDPTGLSTDVQIFTADKGDYYALDTSIPIRP